MRSEQNEDLSMRILTPVNDTLPHQILRAAPFIAADLLDGRSRPVILEPLKHDFWVAWSQLTRAQQGQAVEGLLITDSAVVIFCTIAANVAASIRRANTAEHLRQKLHIVA